MKERILRGIPISSGVGIGKIYIYQRKLPPVEERVIPEARLEEEISSFRSALSSVEGELNLMYQKVREEMGADIAEFIKFQILLLKDKTILEGVEKIIREKKRDAAFAYHQVIKDYISPMLSSPVPFMRDRIIDIMDLAERILLSLLGRTKDSLLSLSEEVILFAHNLAPTDVAMIDKRFVKGVAVESGGKSGHVAIMTKAREIPAVNGIPNLLSQARAGFTAIVDGNRGVIILNPNEKRLGQYRREMEEERRRRASYSRKKEEEPITRDGKYIDLSANIEFIGEVEMAKEYGAKGIGLFRTEYIFLSRRRLPTEEEQLFFYQEVSSKMKPYPVIIRTFDLGGDKIIPGYSETNPFLGWRGIRVGLQKKDFLITQIRAILKASAQNKNLKIMFPMITGIEEIQACRVILNSVKEELKEKRVPFDPAIEFGIMVETPACALLAEKFAKICSFFSIGSNDLIQYTLACARDNEKVAHLYDPFHPAVIRLYKETIDAARKNGIWVGVCGELASEPLGIILLVGLGIDELSMVPHRIPVAKEIIRSLEFTRLQDTIKKILTLSTGSGVKRFLVGEVKENFPKLSAIFG